MAPDLPPRRERAASDRGQEIPTNIPKRPSLQSRTISAPAGGLYKLNNSTNEGNKVRQPLIEEDEVQSPTNGSFPRSHAVKTGDEVCNHVVFHESVNSMNCR